METIVDPNEVMAWGGAALALLLQYAPGLAPWYDRQESSTKKLIALGSCVLAVVAVLGWDCQLQAACLQAGWREYAEALVIAVFSQQGVARVLPLSSGRRLARERAAEHSLRRV
jgi:hypothetical protein